MWRAVETTIRDLAAEWVRDTCMSQRLSVEVTDAGVLHRIAVILSALLAPPISGIAADADHRRYGRPAQERPRMICDVVGLIRVAQSDGQPGSTASQGSATTSKRLKEAAPRGKEAGSAPEEAGDVGTNTSTS